MLITPVQLEEDFFSLKKSFDSPNWQYKKQPVYVLLNTFLNLYEMCGTEHTFISEFCLKPM